MNKTVDGRDVRRVAAYLIDGMTRGGSAHDRCFGLPSPASDGLAGPASGGLPSLPTLDDGCARSIVLFRRALNRRILNEDALASALASAFGLPVELVNLEATPVDRVILAVRRAQVRPRPSRSLCARCQRPQI